MILTLQFSFGKNKTKQNNASNNCTTKPILRTSNKRFRDIGHATIKSVE